jgi:hypothetical protein
VSVKPTTLASTLLNIIEDDSERLERIDLYINGIQDEPYMPKTADEEYKLLAKRAVSNWMPLIIGTPAQALYVDGFRASRQKAEDDNRDTPEWKHWQASGLDARQLAVHRAALGYGHSFTLTERKRGKILTKGLSPLRTAALYEDAANDNAPYAALTVVEYPRLVNEKVKRGVARLWDGTHEYKVLFEAFSGDNQKVSIVKKKPHGAPECPVTRFAAAVDLEGRTCGVVEPMIPLQNRINQTVFDLLVTQTYASFKVRWVTGMAPPMQMKMLDANGAETDDPNLAVDVVPRLDGNGNPMPASIDHNARRFLFAEDPDTKFGSLDESPLGGFIESIDMSIRHLAAVSQTPPHYLLGQIANLSAEALTAAETALARKVEEFRQAFGESWERVFRIAGAMGGDEAVFEDEAGEVLWRDMESRSLAQSADALGKLAEALEIPKRGLWHRVPDVTQNEIKNWKELREEDDLDGRMADALERASAFGSATSTDTNSRGNLTAKG